MVELKLEPMSDSRVCDLTTVPHVGAGLGKDNTVFRTLAWREQQGKSGSLLMVGNCQGGREGEPWE